MRSYDHSMKENKAKQPENKDNVYGFYSFHDVFSRRQRVLIKENKLKGALELSSGCIYLQNYAQEHARK